jgi:hypothetical protein
MKSGLTELGGLSLSYIFTFDLGSDEKLSLVEQKTLNRLNAFALGFYVVGSWVSRDQLSRVPDFLESYRSEMYERRFKPTMLSQRRTVILQLPPIELLGLTHLYTELIPANRVLTLNCTSTLNEMGVGSIVFWLDLENSFKFRLEQLIAFRDISNLSTQVDWRVAPDINIRLNGSYSLMDIARLVIILLHSATSSRVKLKEVKQKLDSDETLLKVHSEICSKWHGTLKASSEIESYPIFHLNLAQMQNGDKKFLHEFVLRHKAELRGIITGDLNWDKKVQSIVDRFWEDYSFSSRETICWITHPNGSMKIYSSELETPLLSSKLLITFELEIMLTMKQFIYRIIRNLNFFSASSKNKYPLKSLAKLREEEMRRLDDYYNLDILQHDTTINRLDKFRRMFRIDDLLQIALKKFEGLNIYMATEFQNAEAERQLVLTIVFGVFGTGLFVFEGLTKGTEDKVFNLPFLSLIAWTLGSMVAVGILIYLIYRRVRMR